MALRGKQLMIHDVCVWVCARTSSPGWNTSQKLSDTLPLTLTAQTYQSASLVPFIRSVRLLLCLWTGELLPGVPPKKTPRERLLEIPSICSIIKQTFKGKTVCIATLWSDTGRRMETKWMDSKVLNKKMAGLTKGKERKSSGSLSWEGGLQLGWSQDSLC